MVPKNMMAGDLVRLTSLRLEDASTILKWRDDTQFTRLWNSDPLFVRSETLIREWIEGLGGKTDRELALAIRPLQEERIIGTVGLDEIEWPNRVASLGIAIGCPADWGKGYGTEAANLLIGYAFYELNLFRLQLTVFAFNSRAIALYEKLRFQREGTFRQFMERDGTRHDMYLYGLLREEWEDSTLEGAASV